VLFANVNPRFCILISFRCIILLAFELCYSHLVALTDKSQKSEQQSS
jgi:hypothetical protein